MRRPLQPGDPLTWVGSAKEHPDVIVSPGDRGVFLDFDGGPESYVVEFPNGVFCCPPSDVEPDLIYEPTRRRHHGA